MLNAWAPLFADVRLVPGDRGVYDVTLDGELVYSKHATGRHAEPGEVKGIIESIIGPPVLEGWEPPAH